MNAQWSKLRESEQALFTAAKWSYLDEDSRARAQ